MICRCLALLLILLVASQSVFARETCCVRTVGTLPISGADSATSNAIIGIWDGALMNAAETDCPLVVDFISLEGAGELNRYIDRMIEAATGEKPDPARRDQGAFGYLDYQFTGSFTYNAAAGQYSLAMRLFDPDHNATVKEGSTSWAEAKDDPDPVLRFGRQAIAQLAMSFSPLDELIYEYERIPDSCDVEPEKDPVEPEEEISLKISDIVDQNGRPSKGWQRIFVAVEKGEILNGIPREGFRVFEVGDGAVEVKYKALDTCRSEKEKITVYNSCNKESDYIGVPEAQIAEHEFDIEPKKIQGEIEYNNKVKLRLQDFVLSVVIKGSIPFTIHIDEKPSRIEGDGTIPLKGNGSADECSIDVNGSMSAELTGKLKGKRGEEQKLIFRIKQIWHPQRSIITCPDDKIQFPGPLATQMEEKWKIEFPFEDGHRVEWHPPPIPGVRGEFYLVLHIPCLREK